MSNERPDEFAGWAGRLEEPGALAGQGLANKEATWDKLYGRLGNPPGKKRIAGYRLAAACLLLVLIPATLLFRDRKPAPGQTAGQAPGQGSIARDPVLPGKAALSSAGRTTSSGQPAPPAPGGSVDPATQGTIPSHGQENLARSVMVSRFVTRIPHPRTASLTEGPGAAHRVPTKAGTQRPPARVSADTLFQFPLAVTAPPPPALAANLPIAPGRPALLKKELTVISINEIANPVEQEPPVAGHHKRSGRFRIGLNPGFNPGAIRPAMATRDIPKTRLTIKLSSQNP